MYRKCGKCGEQINFGNICLMKDYPYKRRLKEKCKIQYFCSYGCMRSAEKQKPEIYAKRREL